MAPVHVLVFPWPLQGHINSMLPFAAGLLGAGVHVTFLYTEHNLRRVDRATAAASPRLRLVSVPDGLPDDHPRSVGHLSEVGRSLRPSASAAYRALLAPALSARRHADCGLPPVSCVVADSLLPFAIDIAEELGVPALAFRTEIASSILAYLSVPRLVELGEVPIPVGANLDEPVHGVPGMEGQSVVLNVGVRQQCLLRRRCHLLLFGRPSASSNAMAAVSQNCSMPATTGNSRSGTVSSSFFTSAASSSVFPRLANRAVIPPSLPAYASSASLSAIFRWSKSPRSVASLAARTRSAPTNLTFKESHTSLVVSFVTTCSSTSSGSAPRSIARAALSFLTFTAASPGATASHTGFLRRRDLPSFCRGDGESDELDPMLQVLVKHTAHSCKAFLADQQINSRFTDAVWGTGLDMKDVYEKAVVERMVREAMESRELIRAWSAEALAQQVRRDIAKGGSSASEFERLVRFIKELTAKGATANSTVQIC
ncbi:7-deoxyloganetic acid glucosyltransferase-like [Hordeum vulgare subsp. vulgare]|uniref:7-deoxyloganetic acid glucosyltransferase-like n=1 Tax=Hordeum vulgare subsp. vulgare TaxID=112509 RepID=UPI001D1A3AAC|nr:7-deoxyloganetic acid glucosyltransferase-like [Hordeum vulgare subsp. vulgare]